MKKPVSEGYTLYGFVYVTFSKCQHYGGEQVRGRQEVGVAGEGLDEAIKGALQ